MSQFVNEEESRVSQKFNDLEIRKLGDYIRYLSAMGPQRANSGHPGLPLGNAETGVILYAYLMSASAKDPKWINRDRFVLSAGHGSMLVYALNYLFGYRFSLQDLANFRQVGSKTAGHPEYCLEEGVETTTGPLGQGFANAVGIALESKMLAARFNTTDFDLFDFNVFTIMGDGCTMEGITNEAASMAGHLGLDKLIAIYDDNSITIDGGTDIAFSEDVAMRYQALGWEVDRCIGTDIETVYNKLSELKAKKGKPKLLIVKTLIGEGLDKLKGSHKVHGAPAGVEEIAYLLGHSTLSDSFADLKGKSKEELINLIETQLKTGDFFPKDQFASILDKMINNRNSHLENWNNKYTKWQNQYPEKKQELAKYLNRAISNDLKKELLNFKAAPDASRGISSTVLQICAEHDPSIVGGSADLVASTKATIKNSSYVQKEDYSGRNIAFGIREHGMGALGNGLALNRVLTPFTSTFFTFIDYMKPSLRLASLMKLKHLYIFTHDSIYVGEDGPTHEPIEHLGATRLIPDMTIFRPANDAEMGFSYLYFMENELPVAILGTRQKLSATVFNQAEDREKLYLNFKKGAYVFSDCEGQPDIILIGSGSEVGTLMEAKKLLSDKKVRVISMPSAELLEQQSLEYQKQLMPDDIPIFLMEAASHRGFKPFYASNVHVWDISQFGLSGSYKDVAKHFGYTPENVVEQCKKIL